MISDILVMCYRNNVINNHTIFGAVVGAASVFVFNGAARGSLVKNIVTFTNGLPSYLPYKIIGGGLLGSLATSVVMICFDKHPVYASFVRPHDTKISFNMGMCLGLASWLFIPAWKYNLTTALISTIVSSLATNSLIESIKSWRITKQLIGSIQGSDLIDLNGEVMQIANSQNALVDFSDTKAAVKRSEDFFDVSRISEEEIADLMETFDPEEQDKTIDFPLVPSKRVAAKNPHVVESFFTLADEEEMEKHGFRQSDSAVKPEELENPVAPVPV
jgi:hypothetical protein